MDNDGDGNGFFNKRDWNGPIAHKGCFIRCNTARAKVHLRWSSIDDISIKVGISAEKWGKSFFLASLVSRSRRMVSSGASWTWLHRSDALPSGCLQCSEGGGAIDLMLWYTPAITIPLNLCSNSIEDKVGQNLKKEKLHMNIAMISGTDLALDKVTVHNNRPVRKN